MFYMNNNKSIEITGSQNPGRLLMLDKIYWTQEGWPFIGYPSEGPREKPYEE